MNKLPRLNPRDHSSLSLHTMHSLALLPPFLKSTASKKTGEKSYNRKEPKSSNNLRSSPGPPKVTQSGWNSDFNQ